MKREDLIKEWMEGKLSSDELDKKIRGDKELEGLKEIVTQSAALTYLKKELRKKRGISYPLKLRRKKHPR